MKKLNVQQNTDEWLEARKGKVTGTKLKNILPNSRGGNYVGWYEYLAELLYQPTGSEIDGEDPRDRGHRLETEAMELFCQKHDAEVVDDGFYVSDSDERLAFSPDGVFVDDDTQTVEIKCLNPKNHLTAYLEDYQEGNVPKDHWYQVLQAFIVNDDLETMYFVMYCPQLPDIAYFEIEVKREDIEDEISETKAILDLRLKEADQIITKIKNDNKNF